MEEKVNDPDKVQDRIVKLENDLKAQEHRISVIVKNIIDYGFDNSNQQRRNAVWVSLIGYLLSRQTAAILVGGLSTIAACLGIWLAWQANGLIKEQNKLIERQNFRLDQQTYLQESERRSSLVFLMGGVLEAIDKEIKEDLGKKNLRDLTPELIARIVALTHILRPYKFMDGDTLIGRELSPEKGQLLISLLDSKIDTSSLTEIFKKADFSNSFLRGVKFENLTIKNITLDGSDLQNAFIGNCVISDSKLMGVDFSSLYSINCKFESVAMLSSLFSKTTFMGCRFERLSFNGSAFLEMHSSRSDFYSCRMDECIFINSAFYNSSFNEVSILSSKVQGCYNMPKLTKVTINKKTAIDNISFPTNYTLDLQVDGKDTSLMFVLKNSDKK